MLKIGATESGDAGLDLSWADNLQEANVLITKNPTSKRFKELVLEHKDKIVLHVNITGMGGSKVEPNVPIPDVVYDSVIELIDLGFPANQIVLRVDPIIPTEKGINTASIVMTMFMACGIERVRYSFMDMYKHVKERFSAAGLPIPYESFHAPIPMRNKAIKMINGFKNIYQLEVCAEPHSPHEKVGCISNKDLLLLGIEQQPEENLGKQRTLCMCLPNKLELLKKKERCNHLCEYCYWKD